MNSELSLIFSIQSGGGTQRRLCFLGIGCDLLNHHTLRYIISFRKMLAINNYVHILFLHVFGLIMWALGSPIFSDCIQINKFFYSKCFWNIKKICAKTEKQPQKYLYQPNFSSQHSPPSLLILIDTSTLHLTLQLLNSLPLSPTNPSISFPHP